MLSYKEKGEDLRGTNYRLLVVQDANNAKNDNIAMSKLTKNGIRCCLLNSIYNGFNPNDLKDIKCNGVAVLDPDAPITNYPQLKVLYPWCMNRNIPILGVDEWIENKMNNVEIEETPTYKSQNKFPEFVDIRVR